MGKKIYNSLDVAGLEQLASDPVGNLFEGRIYYNTSEKTAKIYDGSAWNDVGSGSGGSAIIPRLNDIFYDTYFSQMSAIDFVTDEDAHVNTGTSTGAFDNALNSFVFSNASETLVTTNLLSADEFVTPSKILGRISLVVIWNEGEVDTSAVYATSINGTTWNPITMQRMGTTTDTYAGTYLYTEVSPTANLFLRVTSSAGSVAILGYGILYDYAGSGSLSGVFLQRPDGVMRELRINNDDELEIYSV